MVHEQPARSRMVNNTLVAAVKTCGLMIEEVCLYYEWYLPNPFLAGETRDWSSDEQVQPEQAQPVHRQEDSRR